MTAAAARGPSTILAVLPCGIWNDDGERVRQVSLRAASGEDAVVVLGSKDSLPAQRASTLLKRCAASESSAIDALSVGDREALLLQLRRITFDDNIEAVLQCPRASCRERLELRLRVGDLLVDPYPAPTRDYAATFDVDDVQYAMRFRLPCSGDLERAAALAAGDPHRGAAELLRSCIMELSIDGRPADPEELTSAAAQQVNREIAALDPQADIELDACCPACGHKFEALFDTGSYLLDELEAEAQLLLADIHTLALHYHWTEPDILAIPAWRRDRYLDLLAAEYASAESAGLDS